MSRTFSTAFRNDIEASSSSELLLCFATITHDDLSEPIRTVSDIVDYIYNSDRYYGIPFEFVLPDDTEQSPKARIRIQNVDQRIGNIVLSMRTSPRIRFDIMAGSDWGAIADVGGRRTRSPTGTPTIEYTADHLYLTNINGDAMMVEANIESWNLSQEPWPSVRSTRERLPGLFR